jgi:hypothetical protein
MKENFLKTSKISAWANKAPQGTPEVPIAGSSASPAIINDRIPAGQPESRPPKTSKNTLGKRNAYLKLCSAIGKNPEVPPHRFYDCLTSSEVKAITRHSGFGSSSINLVFDLNHPYSQPYEKAKEISKNKISEKFERNENSYFDISPERMLAACMQNWGEENATAVLLTMAIGKLQARDGKVKFLKRLIHPESNNSLSFFSLKESSVGDRINLQGFSSTAEFDKRGLQHPRVIKEFKKPGGIELLIKTKKGARISGIAAWPDEAEVLLPHNLPLIVSDKIPAAPEYLETIILHSPSSSPLLLPRLDENIDISNLFI